MWTKSKEFFLGACVIAACGVLMTACGGADDPVDEGSATSQQEKTSRALEVPSFADYSDPGKADSVTGSDPYLFIEPDGEWHSINFIHKNALNLPESDISTLPVSGEPVGHGAIVISNVKGSVRLTLQVGNTYDASRLSPETVPEWSLTYPLMQSYAMVLRNTYRLPTEQDVFVEAPQEDYLNRDYLEFPEGESDAAVNVVELSKDQIGPELQLFLTFFNYSDSVRVKIEPLGWHPDEELVEPTPAMPVVDDSAFEEFERRHAARLNEILERLRAQNASIELAIDTVNKEIAKIDADLLAKERRVSQLISDLDRREDELEDERERQRTNNILLCGLFGACEAALLSEYLRDDSEYQSIKVELEEARREHRLIQQQIEQHHTRRAKLEQERVRVEKRIRELRAEMQHVPYVEEAREQPSLVTVSHQLHLTRDLNYNLKESLSISLQIKRDLLGLSWVLDSYIADLEAFDRYLEAYIIESRLDYYKMLRRFLDPGFDAAQWLENKLIARANALIPKLPTIEDLIDDQLKNFVDSMVKEYFTSPDSPEAKAWRSQVLSNLRRGISP